MIAREHTGHMQKGRALSYVKKFAHRALAAMGERIVIELRLSLFDQFGHFDSGYHVGEGIVSLTVFDVISVGDVLESKARQPRWMVGPLDAIRSQSARQAHHIDDIPARIPMLPLALIGIIKIAVQRIARHFVVETNAVVTHRTGFRGGEFSVDLSDKLGLGKAAFERLLGRDSGH